MSFDSSTTITDEKEYAIENFIIKLTSRMWDLAEKVLYDDAEKM
jgi:hypothetical protein